MVEGVAYVYVNAEKRPSKTAKNAGERSETNEIARTSFMTAQTGCRRRRIVPRGELRIVTLRLRYVAAEVGGVVLVLFLVG